MHSIDANLLFALDALLQEGTVLGAARRVGLTPPAMSRALQRLRDTTGDPILVRAGRRMMPTPRAIAIRERVRGTSNEVRALLGPASELDLATLERTFTIRSSDYLLAVAGRSLDELVAKQAPGVNLTYLPEGDEGVEALRIGEVDIDIGVQRELGPELRVRKLFDEEMVGIVRKDHPLARDRMTPKRWASIPHVAVSRRGKGRGVLDRALEARGLSRRVERVVPSNFAAAWLIARSDWMATVPRRFADSISGTLNLTAFALGLSLPTIPLALAWHPRYDADMAHAWLRQMLHRACTETP